MTVCKGTLLIGGVTPRKCRAFVVRVQMARKIVHRMEPLVTTGAEKHRPVFAAFHRGGRRLHIGLQACAP